MEETPRPRSEREDDMPTDPRFGDADYPSTGEHLVESDYSWPPLQPVAHPDGSVNLTAVQRASRGIGGARDALLGWVQREPAAALGTALALGFVVGFILRRSVFLSAWEMGEMAEVKRV